MTCYRKVHRGEGIRETKTTTLLMQVANRHHHSSITIIFLIYIPHHYLVVDMAHEILQREKKRNENRNKTKQYQAHQEKVLRYSYWIPPLEKFFIHNHR